MQKYILMLLCQIVTTTVIGQDIEPIVADRPDETESPSLVPTQHAQFEFGFYKQHLDAPIKTHEWTLPTLLIKYGLHKRFELRMVLEGSKIVEKNILSSGFQINPVELGFKTSLWEERGLRPKTSLIMHAVLPKWATKERQSNHLGSSFRFTMQHTLSPTWNVGYNLGGELNTDDRSKNGIYTLSVGHSLSSKIAVFLETYGSFTQSEGIENRFNGGIIYTPRPNILLDFSIGKSRYVDDYDFMGLGFSIRLPN
jgi:hypothetical protein